MKFIPVKNGNDYTYSLVDDEDYLELSVIHWYLQDGYAKTSTPRFSDGSQMQPAMHRFILDYDKPLVADHINGVRLDNRRDNLRVVSHIENNINKSKRSDKKYKGISFNKGWWKVYIQKNRQPIYLGIYRDEVEAAKVYDEAAKKLHGDFAKLNFPD